VKPKETLPTTSKNTNSNLNVRFISQLKNPITKEILFNGEEENLLAYKAKGKFIKDITSMMEK